MGLVVVILVVLVGACGLTTCSTYNSLVGLEQAVQSQWGQVQNVYQRRADLVPNLVQTVKGAAAHERGTLQAVVEARAKVGQTAAQAQNAPSNPAELERYQQAQAQLSSALSRLMVVVERYPQIRATENFRDLQAQLEGTENRITVERMRFNEAARAFNTRRSTFPTVMVAGLFGGRFKEKVYFQAQAGSEQAPKVNF